MSRTTITTDEWRREIERLTNSRTSRPEGMRSKELAAALGVGQPRAVAILGALVAEGKVTVTRGLAPDMTGTLKPAYFYKIKKAGKGRAA